MSRAGLIMVALVLVVLVLAAARDAYSERHADDAAMACEQAIHAGYYSRELYGQCLDDYRDSREP